VKKQLASILAAIPLLFAGCSGPDWLNFIAPLTGTVQVSFVNETAYNVSTYWGTYNNLDARHGVVVNKIELAGGGDTTKSPVTVATTRKIAVAGALLRRAAQIGIPANTDPTLIQDTIAFTDASGTTIGTSPAGDFDLGVDYGSNYLVEIHFKLVTGTTNEFTVEIVSVPQ
jgi:hypothetical protein